LDFTSPTFTPSSIFSPLLGERLLRFLGDLLVDRAEEGRQRFEHGHVAPGGARPKPISRPITPEPITPTASAPRDAQGAVVRQDVDLVEVGAPGKARRVRAGREDHVLRVIDSSAAPLTAIS
jgi:hypothetical protein